MTEWIPCSKQLPNNAETVLAWYEFIRDDYDCAIYVIATCYDGNWYRSSPGMSIAITNGEIVAWMPLPEPYKKEGESG